MLLISNVMMNSYVVSLLSQGSVIELVLFSLVISGLCYWVFLFFLLFKDCVADFFLFYFILILLFFYLLGSILEEIDEEDIIEVLQILIEF